MKQNGVKIVTIGGGSSYTPELVEGFIKRYDTLPVSELWLVDIEEGREKLETVFAKRDCNLHLVCPAFFCRYLLLCFLE